LTVPPYPAALGLDLASPGRAGVGSIRKFADFFRRSRGSRVWAVALTFYRLEIGHSGLRWPLCHNPAPALVNPSSVLFG
jgi:hypothetical protein